jgi:cation diffusion facilitator family transporter
LSPPRPVDHGGAGAPAAVIGFVGNEAVAIFRIRTGKEIGSAALVADGYHARIDGLTSLAVLLGATGVWLGFPLADPIIGLLITLAIFRIVWQSTKSVFTRLLDGVDPHLVDEIHHAAGHVPGVEEVCQVRVRWVGHRLHAEVNVAVSGGLSVEEGHKIAKEVRHQLLHHLQYLENATIHVDPLGASGEEYHRIANHVHDALPAHSH